MGVYFLQFDTLEEGNGPQYIGEHVGGRFSYFECKSNWKAPKTTDHRHHVHVLYLSGESNLTGKRLLKEHPDISRSSQTPQFLSSRTLESRIQ